MNNFLNIIAFAFIALTMHAAYSNEMAAKNLQTARNKLCPFVGYNGLSCSGKPPQYGVYQIPRAAKQMVISGESVQPLQLPVGVGISFDITNGDIKLPSLELTYDSTYSWTDPKSGESFEIPREIDASQPNPSEANPQIRVFGTAMDLANVLETSKNQGIWLGGELATSKNIQFIYDNFFRGDKATAISQQYYPFVTIKMKDHMLKLNEFAQLAIDSLPKT